jgi:hypothetical protein
MDGVEQESNITDDPQDEWSVYSDIAEAADALVNGTPTSGLQSQMALHSLSKFRMLKDSLFCNFFG